MAVIAIIYGGRSGEHEVSCTSAAAVLKNLNPSHKTILIGISREGLWYLQKMPSPVPEVLNISAEAGSKITVLPGEGLAQAGGEKLGIDVVLPILHGSFGEDGRIQGLLEMAGLPYAGTGVLGSAVAMDKDVAKRLWLQDGLPVVPWRTLYKESFSASQADGMAALMKTLGKKLFEELGSPLFVKPANAGSSVGVNRAENEKQLEAALKTAWEHDTKILVEKAIEGREIECALMGYTQPEAFPPGEVIPAGNHNFYDYEAKYTDPSGALLKVPAELTEELSRQIKNLAQKAYRCVEAGGLSRVDFLLESKSGKLYINEINTLPGMTSISLFPRMCNAGGVGFTQMLDRLIEGALEEFSRREGLSYSSGL